MNPAIELQRTILVLIISSILICFALSPRAEAIVPAPNGDYSAENRSEGDTVSCAEAPIDGFQRMLVLQLQAPGSLLTLDNGTIKVGVDTSFGGAITYLSQSGTTNNLINDVDHGRVVAQSYYSGPANFHPPGTIQNPYYSPWPWNPTQGGDSYGYSSTALSYSNANGVIYVKTRPKQWALQNYPADCIMEQWTRLDGPAVRIHCKLTNNRSDHNQYPAHGSTWNIQELPAAYGVGTLCHLFTYTGTAPFTGGALTEESATSPAHEWRATENWGAFVNSSHFGVGVHNPEATTMLGGYFLNGGNTCTGGPSDDTTVYLAPANLEVLDWNLVYEYDYNLIVGTLTTIRSWVYAHRGDPRPDYSFGTSRRHWLPNYGDAGAPSGFLREHLNGPDPQLSDYGGDECYTFLGRSCALDAFAASTCPKIYFAARYVMSSPPADPQADLYWETKYSGGLSETRKQSVPVVPDGRWRIYSFNVSANAAWSGLISELRFDPIQSGGTGDYVDIAGISYRNAFSTLLAATDLNDDGKPDYVLYNASTLRTEAFYLNKNVRIGFAIGPTLPAGWHLVGLADFNGDGHPDYLLFNPTTRQSQVWYLSGLTHTTSAYGPRLPSGWQLVASGDFNRDGKPDYVLYNPSTRQTRVWYLNNHSFVGSANGSTVPAGWNLAGVADFDRDGKVDYLLFKPPTRQSQIWYLSRTRYVSAANGPTVTSGWQLAGTADFNRDTKPDYLLYNPSTRQSAIWYMNNNVHSGSVPGPTLPAGWTLAAP